LLTPFGKLKSSVSFLTFKSDSKKYFYYDVIYIAAFYGMVFSANEEAAFSNFLLWEAMGFTVAFAYSTVLCANAKLYVLIGMLGTGMVGYLAVEVKECRRKKANINRKNGTA